MVPSASLTLLATTSILVLVNGGGHHDRHHVTIHVPYKIKHIYHTHTILKHVHKDHGDKYEVLGYSVGKPEEIKESGHGFSSDGYDFGGGHEFEGGHDFKGGTYEVSGGPNFGGHDYKDAGGGYNYDRHGYEYGDEDHHYKGVIEPDGSDYSFGERIDSSKI